jgi:sarcosine oxidase subunit gamma
MAERTEPTRLDPAPAAARFMLQAGDEAAGTVARAVGFPFATALNRAEGDVDGRACLKLGPDEWLLLGAGDDPTALAADFTSEAGLGFSLVDVSDRQVGLVIAGPGAAEALASGILLDLSLAAFPIGMATRTIFEKATVVLWRTGPESFHIEVWRSFAPYVRALIDIALAENAAEAATVSAG